MAKAKVTKLTETAMAVLQASPERRLNITVLNKALFYLDLYALRDLGEVITRHDFIALPPPPPLDAEVADAVLLVRELALPRDLDEAARRHLELAVVAVLDPRQDAVLRHRWSGSG